MVSNAEAEPEGVHPACGFGKEPYALFLPVGGPVGVYLVVCAVIGKDSKGEVVLLGEGPVGSYIKAVPVVIDVRVSRMSIGIVGPVLVFYSGLPSPAATTGTAAGHSTAHAAAVG